MRDSSYHRPGPAHPHELGRATHRIYRQTKYRDDIRRTGDALGRGVTETYAESVRKADSGVDNHRRLRGNRYPNPGLKRLQILADSPNFTSIFLYPFVIVEFNSPAVAEVPEFKKSQ